jgi:hypothetical protein
MAIAAGGKVSEAAKTVAALLHTHFEKEEEYALPPLGVLSELAQGRVTPEMRSAIVMAQQFNLSSPAAPAAGLIHCTDDLNAIGRQHVRYRKFSEQWGRTSK